MAASPPQAARQVDNQRQPTAPTTTPTTAASASQCDSLLECPWFAATRGLFAAECAHRSKVAAISMVSKTERKPPRITPRGHRRMLPRRRQFVCCGGSDSRSRVGPIGRPRPTVGAQRMEAGACYRVSSTSCGAAATVAIRVATWATRVVHFAPLKNKLDNRERRSRDQNKQDQATNLSCVRRSLDELNRSIAEMNEGALSYLTKLRVILHRTD